MARHTSAGRPIASHATSTRTVDAMPRVAVVFTGGTISMRHDPVAGGNVPALSGADILAQVPGLDRIAQIEANDRGLTPASHFTFPALFDIWSTIAAALDDPA